MCRVYGRVAGFQSLWKGLANAYGGSPQNLKDLKDLDVLQVPYCTKTGFYP